MDRTDEAGHGGSFAMPNNTYKSARILSEEYNLYYSVWCDGDHELYDLSVCIVCIIEAKLIGADGSLPDE